MTVVGQQVLAVTSPRVPIPTSGHDNEFSLSVTSASEPRPVNHQRNSEAIHEAKGAQSLIHATGVVGVKASYNLTYHETGLPSGVPWWVVVNGSQLTTGGDMLSFHEFNGTYSYSVATANSWDWWPSPCNGSAFVNGAAVSLPIRWVKLSTIAIVETSLPLGTNWTAALSGSPSSDIYSDTQLATQNSVSAWSDGQDSIDFRTEIALMYSRDVGPPP
jgi:hypothetical protein